MFNRTLRVDVVKKAKSADGEIETPELSFEEKAIVMAKIVERGIRKISFGVCMYVVLDTVRQVAVASVSNEN